MRQGSNTTIKYGSTATGEDEGEATQMGHISLGSTATSKDGADTKARTRQQQKHNNQMTSSSAQKQLCLLIYKTEIFSID